MWNIQLTNIKLYATIGIIFVILGMFSYIMYLRYDNVSLSTSNTLLNERVETMGKQITELNKSIVEIQKAQSNVISEIQSASRRQVELDEKLSKLSAVSSKKPTLVTRLVNKGSIERNRCMELATGATPVDGEKNSICEDFVK